MPSTRERAGVVGGWASDTLNAMWVLRTIMLLALIVWIGGIVFFAFIMAPTLFTVLPNPQLAGDVVGPALTKLHWMGLVSGAVFLISSLTYNWLKYVRFRLFTATHILVELMLVLTAVSQFAITPRMRELRAQHGTTNNLAVDSVRVADVNLPPPDPSEFARLHAWSTRCEGAVLILGLVVVVLTARRLGEDSH